MKWRIEYDDMLRLSLFVCGRDGHLEPAARAGQVGAVEVFPCTAEVPRAAWHAFSEALRSIPGIALNEPLARAKAQASRHVGPQLRRTLDEPDGGQR